MVSPDHIGKRAHVMLVLYFREGWSYRRIGRTVGLHHWQVRRVIDSTLTDIAKRATPDALCATHPLVRALVTFPAESEHEVQRADELEDRVYVLAEQRTTQTMAIERVMCESDSTMPTHVKRNHYDRWELQELERRGTTTLPASAYEAKVLWRYAE